MLEVFLQKCCSFSQVVSLFEGTEPRFSNSQGLVLGPLSRSLQVYIPLWGTRMIILCNLFVTMSKDFLLLTRPMAHMLSRSLLLGPLYSLDALPLCHSPVCSANENCHTCPSHTTLISSLILFSLDNVSPTLSNNRNNFLEYCPIINHFSISSCLQAPHRTFFPCTILSIFLSGKAGAWTPRCSLGG